MDSHIGVVEEYSSPTSPSRGDDSEFEHDSTCDDFDSQLLVQPIPEFTLGFETTYFNDASNRSTLKTNRQQRDRDKSGKW
jgi:hypothetical protein